MEARGINIVNYTEDEIQKIMKLKDLKIILNRLPMLDNQHNSVKKCDSDSKSNIVSEPVKDTSNTHNGQICFDQMRKKMVSRVLKRERITRRGKYSGRRKRQQKLTRVNEESNDDNTTNSENSESNEALNGINWEENIEVSSSLVDEFAPVVSSAKPKASVVKKEESMAFERRLSAVIEEQARDPLEDESEKISAALDSIKSDANDAQEFLPGCGIYVKNYITSEWFAATVVEVDWEEEEVLVHYDDISKTDEWVSMNSQRLLRSKPEALGASPSPEESEIKVEKSKGSSESSGSNDAFMGFKEEPIDYQDISATIKNIKKEREDEVGTESIVAAGVSPKSAVTRPFLPPVDLKKESLDDEIESPPIRMSGRRMKRKFKSRKGWKAKLHQPKIRPLMPKSYSKFKSGEKVLAKWSDHRMQKFPAIIKTVLENGSYDVLFYDGFEKTIKEDHLYKTTEEEVAKYHHTNPSEADTFVDMDADSKEARRQRKKKTFDDYVFDPEQLTKGTRRKSFREDVVPVKSRGNFGKSPPPPTIVATPSEGSKTPVDGERAMLKSLHSGKGVRRKRKRGAFDKNESLDSSSDTAMKRGDPERPTRLERFPTKVQVSSSIFNDKRWKSKISPGVMPVNIECADGTIRKSVVVPDSQLPSGWSKHALLNPLNTWDIFLLSPDGYRILHQEDLKRYCYEIDQNVPPAGLDFMTNVAILAELSLKQTDMPASTTVPRIWMRKKVGRGRKSLVPGVRAFTAGEDPKKYGRVKTLLPKCRFDQLPVTPGPQTQTLGADTEDEWKCPKDGCSKHFRKESLLQMHIKHYHSELSSLVRNTPNMVDLACARSESVNSEWAHHEKILPPDTPKAHPVKKILPKSSPHSAGPSTVDVLKQEVDPISSSPPSAFRVTLTPLKKLMPDEKRSTIKTMLPIRSAEPQKQVVDTKVDSDEDFIEQKKNGSRIFKPGKLKKGRYIAAGSRGVEGYSLPRTIRFTKKKPAGVDKLQLTTDSNDSYPEDEKTSPTTEVTEDGVVIERLRSEEIINCTCNFREEDGLMIQCDICMCWQHGFCSDIENDTDVPEKYICHTCKNPFRVRSSKKYDYAQHYLTQGKLPTFRFSSRNEEEIKNRENMLKRCFEISSSLHDIKNVESSLTAKINIAEQADHPKLYLWAKNWESSPNIKSEKNILSNNVEINGEVGKELIRGPQPPEAPIDLEECRLRLLDHVDSYYQQIDDRLTSIQAQVAALESLDPDLKSNHLDDKQQDKLIKKTLHMLIRDISSIQKLAAIT